MRQKDRRWWGIRQRDGDDRRGARAENPLRDDRDGMATRHARQQLLDVLGGAADAQPSGGELQDLLSAQVVEGRFRATRQRELGG
jgi:hypothetical protein